MAFATGVVIANNYYAQPLEAAIADAFDASSSAVGAVLTLIQLAYALGLATLVPLGDLLERRRLTVLMLSVVVLGQLVVAVAPDAGRAGRRGGPGRADDGGRPGAGAVRRAPGAARASRAR